MEHFGISLALLSHSTIMIILFKKFQIMYRNIQYNHIFNTCYMYV